MLKNAHVSKLVSCIKSFMAPLAKKVPDPWITDVTSNKMEGKQHKQSSETYGNKIGTGGEKWQCMLESTKPCSSHDMILQ